MLTLVALVTALLADAPTEQRLLLTGGPRQKIVRIVGVRGSDGRPLPFRVETEPRKPMELLLLTRHPQQASKGIIQDLRTSEQRNFFDFADVHSAVNELVKSSASPTTLRVVLVSANRWQDFGTPFRAEVLTEPSEEARAYAEGQVSEPNFSHVQVTLLHRTKQPSICHLAMFRDPRPLTVYVPVFPRGSKDVEWNAIRKGVASVNGFVIEANSDYRGLAEQIERNSVVIQMPLVGREVVRKKGQPTRTQFSTVEITFVDDRGRTVRIRRTVH